jgi:thioredoxin reductase
MELFKAQAERFGTEMVFGEVTAVNPSRPFTLIGKERYATDARSSPPAPLRS